MIDAELPPDPHMHVIQRPRLAGPPAEPAAMRFPRWVVLSIAASVFLTISAAHTEIGVLMAIRAPTLSVALGLLGFLIYAPTRKGLGWDQSRFFRYLAVAWGIAILGVPFAIVGSEAFAFLNDSLKGVLIQTVIVWAVCRTTTDRLILMRALTAGFTVACFYGLRAGTEGGRLSGTDYYDANDLALNANLAIPLLVWYALDPRNRFRWVGLLALPIPLLTILQADSRGGMLGFAAMAVAVGAFYSRRAPRKLKRLLPIVTVLGVAGLPFLPSSTIERLRTIGDPEQDYNMTSETGRIAVWTRGVGYALSNPITGVGLNNFYAAEGRSPIAIRTQEQGEGFKWGAAHSIYIQAFAELGLIGGGALILLFLLTTRDLLRIGRSQREGRGPEAVLAGLLGISFVGFLVSGAFLSWVYYPTPHIMLAMAYGLMQSMPGPQRPRRRLRPGARRKRPARPQVRVGSAPVTHRRGSPA